MGRDANTNYLRSISVSPSHAYTPAPSVPRCARIGPRSSATKQSGMLDTVTLRFSYAIKTADTTEISPKLLRQVVQSIRTWPAVRVAQEQNTTPGRVETCAKVASVSQERHRWPALRSGLTRLSLMIVSVLNLRREGMRPVNICRPYQYFAASRPTAITAIYHPPAIW